MRRTSAGFTLTEMLVVLAIIGVLAGMILPAVGQFRKRARVVATQKEIAELSSACQQFYLDVGYYPPDRYDQESMTPRSPIPPPPQWNVRAIFGLPAHSSMRSDNTFSATSQQLRYGSTSVCLVFWLSTQFTYAGKTYGPYYENFHPDQLVYIGQTYPGRPSGAGYQTTSAGQQYRWWVTGFDINQGRLVRRALGGGAPLYRYRDKFGVLRPNATWPYDKNYYVYDSYRPGGAYVNYVMHNAWEFDLFSYGPDGLSVLDNVPGTANQAAIDDLRAKGKGAAIYLYAYLGGLNDDINNWSEGGFKSTRVK